MSAVLIAIGLSPALVAQDTETDGTPIHDRDRIQDGAQEGDGDPAREEAQNRLQDCDGFVDEDGDGICDNCGGEGECTGDQAKDQTQTQSRDCDGFVDEDGDGICDNCGGEGECTGDQTQTQSRDCDGFVDEDGDGICDNCGGDHTATQTQTRKRFRRGDVDENGVQEVSDVVVILKGLFRGEQIRCADACDVNDDGSVDVSDPVRLLRALFCGGDNPPAPFRNHGEDPTPDRLGCGE